MKNLFFLFLCLTVIVISSYGQCRIDYSNYNLVLNEQFNYNQYNDLTDVKSRWRLCGAPWDNGPSDGTDVCFLEEQFELMESIEHQNTSTGTTTDFIRITCERSPDYPCMDYDTTPGPDGINNKDRFNEDDLCIVDTNNPSYGMIEKTVNYKSGRLYLKEITPNNNPLGISSDPHLSWWNPNSVSYPTDNNYYDSYGYKYGMFEVRCKYTVGPGSWVTFWLWNGKLEIDVFEAIRQMDDNEEHFLSNVYDTDDHDNKKECSVDYTFTKNNSGLGEVFHTYTCVWTPEQITIFFDGRELRTITNDSDYDPNDPVNYFDVVLENHTAGYTYQHSSTIMVNYNVSKWAVLDAQNTPGVNPLIEGHLDVDYVKVWKPKDQNGDNTINDLDHILASYKNDLGWMSNEVTNEDDGNSGKSLAKLNSFVVSTNSDRIFFKKKGVSQIYMTEEISPNVWSAPTNISPYIPWSNGKRVSGELHYHPDGFIVYRGKDKKLYDLRETVSGSWTVGTIGDSYVSGTPGSVSIRNNGDIAFKGTDDKLHVYKKNSNNTYDLISPNFTYSQGRLLKGDLAFADHGTIFYKGKNNRLQSFWLNGSGSYQHADIDNNWGTTDYTVNTRDGSITLINGGRVLYVDKNNKMRIYQYSNGTWNTSLPFDNYSGGNYIKGNIFYSQNSNSLFYIGTKGRVMQLYEKADGTWERWYIDDYWNTQKYLSFAIGNTDSQGNVLSASLKTSNNGNVFYVDQDNYIRYFKYENCENLNPPCGGLSTPKPTVELNRLTNVKNKIFIFPNPAKNQIFINNISEEITSVKISDILGKEILSTQLNGINKLSIANFQKGTYFISFLKGNEIIESQKFIKL